MFHIKNRILGLVTLLIAALSLSSCGNPAQGSSVGAAQRDNDEAITLRYAFFAPEQSFPSVQMQEWADRLHDRTDGQVEVELFVGGTLLGAGDIYDGVSQGVVDIGLDSPAYDTGRFPFSSVINLPSDIESSQVASQTFLDLLTEFEPSEFNDFQIITAFTTEPAYIQSINPVESRQDINGMSLRSAGTGVPMQQDLGASPVSLPMSDVAESMGTGVVSGYVSSREVMQDFGLAENINYVTDYPFGISNSFVAVMDQERFEQLPKDVQNEIMNLREEMTLFASQYHDKENVQPALEEAEKEHGVETIQLGQEEEEAWDQLGEAQTAAWLDEHADADFNARQTVERMHQLIDQYSSENSS